MDANKSIHLNGRTISVPDWDTRIAASSILLELCPPDEATRQMLITKALSVLEACPCPAD